MNKPIDNSVQRAIVDAARASVAQERRIALLKSLITIRRQGKDTAELETQKDVTQLDTEQDVAE